MNEGFSEVGKKAAGFDLLTPAQLSSNLLTDIEPVVIGPGGKLYLTDGHHTFTALEDSIYGSSNPLVYVNVIANYSNLDEAQFFAQMQASNFLLPLNDGQAETVNDATGAPIPTTLTGLTSDPYRGLEYSLLKNKNSKLFPTTTNLTGAVGSTTPGLDKMTGLYSDFLEAAAYRDANGGLGLPYLSPGDIALSTQWNLNGANQTTLPNVAGPVTVAQLPGYILSKNIVLNQTISNATLANGALDGNGTFTGITEINAGTASNPILIGTPNTGFIMELGADNGDTVTLSGANTYTGGTSILAGTLIVTSDGALGAAPSAQASIDTSHLAQSIQADNGIIFNSLSEGAGTLQIGTTSGAGTQTFTTSRPIAVDGESATINLNGYIVTLNGALYSLGTAGVGIGNATGFSDLTIDDNSSNQGVLILATPSPDFYGNIIIGNANAPTVRVMNDAALGATTGNPNAIGQIELNGGTLQAGASFNASERNLFLGGGSTIDTAGFTTTWGTLSDTQRTLTITDSNSSQAGAATFAGFTVASTASLALTGKAGDTVTFTNGIQRSGPATLIIQASGLGQTQKLLSGVGAASLVDGIAPAWIVTTGASKSAGPYDFVTYGANGYVKATYSASTLTNTPTATVALAANDTPSGNVAAYALNAETYTVSLGSNTLTLGDGTANDPAGLILGNGSAIAGGTLAFGGSEGVIWLGGATTSISAALTGSNGLTFAGSGAVTLGAAANVSGLVTIGTGGVTLAATDVFKSDSAGLLLQNTKSTPAKASLTISANNTVAALNSDGNNSVINIATGATLTIGDTTNNESSTLSSAISGTGTAALVKAGSGLLDLSGGKVSGIGTIAATGGALRVAVGTSGSVNYALSNGADLQFAQNGGGQYAGAITGNGTLHLIGGTLQLTGTANTYSGGTIVETGSTLDLTTANLSSANENITDAGGLVVFDQSSAGTYTGVISDGKELGSGPTFAGSLVKDDSSGANGGNLTLSAVQTYTGATSVEAGTLTLGVANAIAASSGVTLGRVGGGATASLALMADETLASLTNDAANTATVDLNGHVLTLDPSAATLSAFSGLIADGTAAGALVVDGAGTVDLSGANTYTGGTTIAKGTLELGANGAAGTGAITFATASGTLKLDAALTSGTTSFGPTLAALQAGDEIDLSGLAYAAGATATLSGATLTVASQGISERFTLASPAVTGFQISSDASGGTLVTAGTAPSNGSGSGPGAGSGGTSTGGTGSTGTGSTGTGGTSPGGTNTGGTNPGGPGSSQTLIASLDATSQLVEHLYIALLDRAADPSGLATFDSLYNAHPSPRTTRRIAGDILQSAEFATHHGQLNDRQFVEALYEGALGRPAENAALQRDVHELHAGTSRAALAVSVAESPEAIGHLAGHPA
jgi:autotransporter-associated beta strand protein